MRVPALYMGKPGGKALSGDQKILRFRAGYCKIGSRRNQNCSYTGRYNGKSGGDYHAEYINRSGHAE